MKVIIADHSGFCFGVKRAIDIASTELESEDKRIYSYGPLIHNPQEVNRLEKEGLRTIDDYRDVDEGKIIIRSHGVPKNQEEDMKSKGLEVIDTTCPYVKAVHKRVEDYSLKGYTIAIIGDPNHPEVIGIKGYAQGDVFIINSLEEVEKLPALKRVCVVSQTTNRKEKFDSLVEAIEKKAEEAKVFNTICNATKNRQEAARQVAQMVDAMIVLGGKMSSNTKKLAEISRKYCPHVYHIESIKELSLQDLKKFNTIGITAGASTPDWIIKEAVEAMENLNNDQMNNEMMEAIENTFTRIYPGQIIKGEVLFVTDNEVMVNINYRSDGIITKEELTDDPDVNPKDLYKEGDEIEVFVVRMDDGEGNVVLSSKRVEDLKQWDVLEEKFKNKEKIEVKVLKAVKGGLIATYNGGLNGFIPASQVSVKYVSELESYVGQKFPVEIIEIDREKKRLIFSRKEVERKEIEAKKEALWDSLEEGKIIEGEVVRLTDFGAFVDLGGVDGLIHISDLSWFRVKHPSDVVKPGDRVEVKVLSFDKEKNRISLGLKQTVDEPWVVFTKSVNVGDIVEGEVVNLQDFGAFVRLESGVDGLLHVSQISNKHIAKPSDVLEVGQKVKVKVLDINEKDRKISLSMKEANGVKEEAERKEVEAEELPKEDLDTTIEDIVKNK